MNLEEFFKEYKKVGICVSGGTDSAYLLCAAKQYGADIRAYYVKTQFQPKFELEDARRVCAELGIELTVLKEDVLADENIVTNPINRCYYCKKRLFSAIKAQAQKDGITTIADGTNATDDAEDRPGMRAAKELGVRSPLRESGIGKQEIREGLKAAGMWLWDKPSYACLATRTEQGERIDRETLQGIERAETALAKIGLRDFRVRLIKGAAVLQVREEQMQTVYESRNEIREIMKQEFQRALLDLEARKGE